jgi:flagellar assembly protein FliH
MAFVTLIPFDRPLAGGVISGQTGPLFTETEMAGRLQAAYHAGGDAARAVGDQQMVEFRSDMQQLSEGVLKKVGGIELLLVSQLRQALPSLAQEIARRLFADFEPPPEVIERFWREALDQLYPEREGLELALCPRDAELLEQLNPEWRQRYPGLLLRVDPTLVRGDCLVRSRFGLIDARQKTKLQGLERALVGA